MTIPSTPCRNICVLDAAEQRCIGCGRTLDEIALWPSLDEDERARIMARLREADGEVPARPAARVPPP